MSGSDRIMIFSSRTNLVLMKQRIASAEKGLSLLKRKRDALEIYLRQLSAELKQQREKQDAVMQEAIFSMAKARFLRTDFKPASVMNPDKADVFLRMKNIKIVGLQVPTYELMMKASNALSFTGLSSGGQQVQVVREKFREALKVLVAIASLQYKVVVLSEALKQSKMRANGLEYVVLPRYHNTVDYIREELDELEREEFYRLKCSQVKQLKKKSEFIKLFRQHRQEKETIYPDYDFTNTHLQTPLDEILAAKPENLMQGPRRTVSKIHDKTIVIEKEDEEPLHLDVQLDETTGWSSPEINIEKVVTSSSSSVSLSSD